MNRNNKGSLHLFEKFKTNNLKSIVGGEYSYADTEAGTRHDEHLITNEGGRNYVDGLYWCDTQQWEYGGGLTTMPPPPWGNTTPGQGGGGNS